MQEILIESIRTDGAVQSRSAINPEYVTDLAEQINAGVKLPPVDVYRTGDETWLADGFHRLRAHESVGARTIRAEVHKGTKAEAAWHSAGANTKHGLRRTNADKRRAVEMALKLKPTASDALIAGHCGVSDKTVADARRVLASTSEIPRLNERTGADGKTRRLPPPPQPKPPKPQQVTEETPRRVPPPPPPTPPPRPVDLEPEEPETHDLDEVGKPIPDHLSALFLRAGEIDRLLRLLSEVRGEVRRGEDDALWLECDRQAAEAGLAQAYEAIRATAPYAVCPWCHGKAPMLKGCRGCNGRGAIGKFRYENVVPRELK